MAFHIFSMNIFSVLCKGEWLSIPSIDVERITEWAKIRFPFCVVKCEIINVLVFSLISPRGLLFYKKILQVAYIILCWVSQAAVQFERILNYLLKYTFLNATRDKTHKKLAFMQQKSIRAKIINCTPVGLKSRNQIFMQETNKFSWENFSLRSRFPFQIQPVLGGVKMPASAFAWSNSPAIFSPLVAESAQIIAPLRAAF